MASLTGVTQLTLEFDERSVEDRARASLLGVFADDILAMISEFLPWESLLEFQCASRRHNAHRTHPFSGAIWRSHCARAWHDRPRYRLTTSRETWLNENLPDLSWQQRFLFYHVDLARRFITTAELESFSWELHFTPAAGATPSSPGRAAVFESGYLRVALYPPLKYVLTEKVASSSLGHEYSGVLPRVPVHGAAPSEKLQGSGPLAAEEEVLGALRVAAAAARAGLFQDSHQEVLIADFPPHNVARLPNGEWEITNENVRIKSYL